MNLIDVKQNGPLASIILNRPEKRNALSLDALKQFQHILYDIKKKKDVRVIIIKGNGPDFCSGHDLTEFVGNDHSIHHFRRVFTLSSDIMQTMHQISQPIIAQVHGNATAAGCQLVASCDLAIAEKEALFSTPGVKIGLFCSTPMVPLSRSIGKKQALEMLLTGEPITAEKAKNLGLINKVVDKKNLEHETVRLAQQISRYSTIVLGLGKQTFYQQIDRTESNAYHLTKEILALNCLVDDAQEGITAKLEKRKPQWSQEVQEKS